MDKTQIQEQYARLPEALLPWYAANARPLPWRGETDPYRVWLSETMLQQTRADTVKAYYARFLAAFPTVADLANAPIEQTLKLWEGLGYYSRAHNLHKAAQMILAGGFPQNIDGWRALPGVGAYTAGAVCSICHGLPTPAVDGNVLRAVARITGDTRCVDDQAVKQSIAENLAAVYPQGRCGDFTQALMELGATVCVPNGAPLCGVCPAAGFCRALKTNAAQTLPARKPKRPRAIQAVTMLHITDAISTLLQNPPQTGLLRGLYQLPNIKQQADWQTAYRQLFGDPKTAAHISETSGKHIFTHIEWHITCHHISVPQIEAPIGFTRAALTDLPTRYPVATAFKKFLYPQNKKDAAT